MDFPHETPSHTSNAAALADRLRGLIPVLHTERLRLRAPMLTDFATYADLALAPRGRFILAEPDREDAWFDFNGMIACWLLRGHGLWTVEKRQDGEIAGFVLIGFEPGDHEPELGYMFVERAEGQGFASEAARAVKTFAFTSLGFETLVSIVDHDNHRSVRVAQKLGGVRDPAAERAHGDAAYVFRYKPE